MKLLNLKYPTPLNVLLVDDDEDDFILIRELLADAHSEFKVEWTSDFEKAKTLMKTGSYQVFLIDYQMGSFSGTDVLKFARTENLKAPIILLTGYQGQEADLEAMQLGAADYLIKGQTNSFMLERSIRYALFRAQSIEEIKEREENFRSLLDSSFEGILVHDQKGEIFELNQAACDIFKLPKIELEKLNLKKLGDLAFVESALGGQSQAEARAFLPDGTELMIEVSSKPYSYKSRDLRLTAVRDISTRKNMEAQILMQDRLASIGLLASSLAHEIGTPLGVIRGRAEYLAMQVEGNSSVMKNVDIIISQIDRVTRLIKSLLTLARGTKGERSEVLNLYHVVDEVLVLMNHEFKKKKIQIVNEMTSNLDIQVSADSESLHQVFLNLFINAVHAIESEMKFDAQKEHKICISSIQESGNWKIAIQDTGCGIPPENLKQLFKPFFTTKEIGVGTGLGLATSYRIIESWGGRIEVASQVHKGSTFTLIFPMISLKNSQFKNIKN